MCKPIDRDCKRAVVLIQAPQRGNRVPRLGAGAEFTRFRVDAHAVADG